MDPDGRFPNFWSQFWDDLKNACIATGNLDFGRDFTEYAKQAWNNGNYFKALLFELDATCEITYDTFFAYCGAEFLSTYIFGNIVSKATTGITINLINETKIKGHIFSPDHIKNGIMKLGKSSDDIFNKILDSIRNIELDKIKNGSNELRTTINGVRTTVRFFVQDGEVINIDAFTGYSERVIGNLIE